MMAQLGGFVAFACSALLFAACGDTARNSANSDTSDATTDTSGTSTATSGSGGSTTQGVTATAATSSGTGTGGTAMPSCPSFEPAAGSTCSEEGLVCTFANCQPPDYNDGHVLTCVAGAWTLTHVSACPSSPLCPLTPPLVGSACNETINSSACTFENACGVYLEVACVDGTWQTAGAKDKAAPADPALPLPTCPTYPPFYGDPCCPSAVPEACDYSGTATGTDGAAGASFRINPTVSTSGGGAEPPPTLLCAICTAQMTWDYCPE